jgi:hypothetical protein
MAPERLYTAPRKPAGPPIGGTMTDQSAASDEPLCRVLPIAL